MSARDTKRKDPDMIIFLLLALFFAILLKDTAIGSLNWIWVVVMGAIIVVLSVAAVLIHKR